MKKRKGAVSALETEEKEIWKPVKIGEYSYLISSFGRVKSSWYGTELRQHEDRGGYLRVRPSTSPYKRIKVFVHRLVLTAFVSDRPPNCECRHLDANRKNNRLSNLAWGTRAQNSMDRQAHRNNLYGERNHGHKLSLEDVIKIRSLPVEHPRARWVDRIAKQFSVCRVTINDILSFRSWNAKEEEMRKASENWPAKRGAREDV